MNDYISELAERFGVALAEASENAGAVEARGDAKYSIKNTKDLTLKEQLSRYYKNRMISSDAFSFGSIDLNDIGLGAGQLAMTQSDYAKSAKGKHNTPRRVFNNLVDSLQNKKILSFGENERTGVLIDDIDGDGKPILVALTKGTMDREAVLIVNSVYGVEQWWVESQVNRNRELKIYDIEKATAFLQTNGYKAEVGEKGDFALIKTQESENVKTKFSTRDEVVQTADEVAKNIASQIEELYYDAYEARGIRVDNYDYGIGDTVNNSHELFQDPVYDDEGNLAYPEGEGYYKGFYDAGELDGASTVGIKTDSINGIEKSVKKALEQAKSYMIHENNFLYLVGGDSEYVGNDPGEKIISSSVVQKKYIANSDGTFAEVKGEDIDQSSVQYGVTDVNGGYYEAAVKLEYNEFNRIKNNRDSFIRYIHKKLLGKKIPVTNSDGSIEVIEVARKNDRHKKGAESKPRRTLGKLESQSNPNKMLLIANAEELTEISKFVKSKPSDDHQWLDHNGWEERETFAIFDDDKIYPAILHIAKAKDGRNILYDVGIKFNEGVAIAQGAATPQNASGQLSKITTPSGESIAQTSEESNTQMEDVDQSAYQTTKALSDRDILEMAAGEIEVEGLTEQQKQALQNFKDRLDKLGELKRELGNRLAKYKAGVKENQAQSKYRTLNGASLYYHAA